MTLCITIIFYFTHTIAMNRRKPPFSFRSAYNLLSKKPKKKPYLHTQMLKDKQHHRALVKDGVKATYYAGVTLAMLANCINNELEHIIFLIPGSTLPARKCIEHLKSIVQKKW